MSADHRLPTTDYRLLATDYCLLDFGRGRRLERFGPWIFDRPCPAAEPFTPAHPALWQQAHARFVRTASDSSEAGEWTAGAEMPERWTVNTGPFRLKAVLQTDDFRLKAVLRTDDFRLKGVLRADDFRLQAVLQTDGLRLKGVLRTEGFRLELKRCPFGHLGIFPEQAANWQWIAERVARAGRPLKVLNLFGYTGGSTLAAAAAGAAEVVHVDAAQNTVGWARRNAELSGLADAPVRWIAEDAAKFVRRELKRGNAYDAVILDPPSYGHGRRGEVWRLSTHLPRLLADCARLTAGRREFVLLTAHTPDFDAHRLGAMLAEALDETDEPGARLSAEPMLLRTTAGDELPSGVAVRWSAT